MTIQAPSKIKFHRRSQVLELVYGDENYQLSAEYLRVFSPSAEVKGHGPGQEVLQVNKSDIAITGIEPQGNYAIKLIFSDKHDSGIFTWEYLYQLGINYSQNWQGYLVKAANYEETKNLSAVKWIEPK